MWPGDGRFEKFIPRELHQSHERLSASESILHGMDNLPITLINDKANLNKSG